MPMPCSTSGQQVGAYPPTGACDAGDALMWAIVGAVVGGLGTLVVISLTGETTVKGLTRRAYGRAKKVYGK